MDSSIYLSISPPPLSLFQFSTGISRPVNFIETVGIASLFMSFLFGKKKKAKAETPMDRTEALSQKIAMLEKREAFVEKHIADQIAEAKKYMKAGQKSRAMQCMKRKKNLEGQLAKYAGMRQNLENQKDLLADAALNADIFDEMKKNSETLKQAYGGLDQDQVEEMLDDIEETNQTAQEISDALARPMGGAMVDEDELWDELAGLMEDGAEEVAAPSAPQRVPAAAVADDDEAELGALMQTFGA